MNEYKARWKDIKKSVPPLDDGIRCAVKRLTMSGIETIESCEGGAGHSFAEPTVLFDGDVAEGYKAVTIALQHGFQVKDLHRTWSVINFELTNPVWALVFWKDD